MAIPPLCTANDHDDGLGGVSISGRDFEVAHALVEAHRQERERGCMSGGMAHYRVLGAYRAECEKAERERVLAEVQEEFAPSFIAASDVVQFNAGEFRAKLARIRGEDV